MRMYWRILSAVAFAGACRGAAGDGQDVIARVRAYAAEHAGLLHDFVCTRTVTRSTPKGSGTRPLDRETDEVTYSGGKEHLRTLSITDAEGKATRPPSGYTSISGEFSLLPLIFNPQASVEFAWERAEGSTCVLRYTAALGSRAEIVWHSEGKRSVEANHGYIYADCATGRVTRLVLQGDAVNAKDPNLESDITYSPVSIGPHEYMLPVAAHERARLAGKTTIADLTLTGYRKYDADSKLKFEDEADVK